jgi:deoxyribose-phosphate aldolase
MSIATFIDHTVLKSTSTVANIRQNCSEAMEYKFAAVCIPPVYVPLAYGILKNSNVNIATVIGFPFGYHHVNVKFEETARALKEGANEIDMVINLTALKNKDYSLLEVEAKELLHLTQRNNAVLKIIIESGILSNEEIMVCCKIYSALNVDFLKTSTGYAEKGANLDDIKLMRKHLLPHIKIKASGGIKTYSFAKELVDAGADRLGCSASLAIVKGEREIQGENN